MCGILQNRKIKKVLVIFVVMLLIFNIFPNKAQALSFLKMAGGVIINAALDFLVFLGDTVLNLLQENFISTEDIIIQAKSGEYRSVSKWDILKIIVGVLVIVASVVITVASWGSLSGAGVAGLGLGIKLVGGVIAGTVAGGIIAVNGTTGLVGTLQGKFDLPMIRYTPYEIFSNQIPMLDVNFISPMDSVTEIQKVEAEPETETKEEDVTLDYLAFKLKEDSIGELYKTMNKYLSTKNYIDGYNSCEDEKKEHNEEYTSQTNTSRWR